MPVTECVGDGSLMTKVLILSKPKFRTHDLTNANKFMRQWNQRIETGMHARDMTAERARQITGERRLAGQQEASWHFCIPVSWTETKMNSPTTHGTPSKQNRELVMLFLRHGSKEAWVPAPLSSRPALLTASQASFPGCPWSASKGTFIFGLSSRLHDAQNHPN